MRALALDIWHSFRALPLWVQLWIAVILVPVNFASLLFLHEPQGMWIAFLAVFAILPNVPVLLVQRGFSRMMALPHVPAWTALVIWLVFFRPQGSAAYQNYLWLLLAVDLVSLGFDYTDAVRWWRGDRKPAGQ